MFPRSPTPRVAVLLRRWWRQPPWFGLAVALAIVCVGGTAISLIGLSKASAEGLLILVAIDAIALLLLAVPVARRVGGLWRMRRQGIVGAKLYSRLVSLFSLLAVVPALLVLVFSAVMFNAGLEHWFSQKVKTALSESLDVAQAYLEEHQQIIRADAVAMANDLNWSAPLLLSSPQALATAITNQTGVRGLTEAVLFDSKLNILARSGYSLSLEFAAIPAVALNQAATGEVVVLTSPQGDRVRALLRLDRFVDAFLYVGRAVDPKVIAHTETTKSAVGAYLETERQRLHLKILVTALIALVGLVLLLLATWLGLIFANRLVQPIARLAAGAEALRQGRHHDIPLPNERDEIRNLTKTFNRMAVDLTEQRKKLEDTNEQLDLRRRFTETVLEGVTAGVIGLDEEKKLQIFNHRAGTLLHAPLSEYFNHPIETIFPEILPLVEQHPRPTEAFTEKQLLIERGDTTRTLLARAAPEIRGGEVIGYILTFDDITDLLHAQKTAAWADVARRLAHEIKNPLTPIQLAAERLQRRFGTQIHEGQHLYEELTSTIVRQVNDIGRLVDEFSSFARMPTPVKRRENLIRLLSEAITLFKETTPHVAFRLNTHNATILLPLDAGLLRQAFTNILKNAVEALEEKFGTNTDGIIEISVHQQNNQITISFKDNGHGFKADLTHKPNQLYFTTKRNGTGLGLSIVRKILEDNGGSFTLRNNTTGGAEVRVSFTSKSDTSGI
ncbi:MAG: ATP-binding protein [Holosporales bacterium]